MTRDTQEYQRKLSELRQQLIDTLMEIDTINLQVNPHILADYAKTIGYLETDLYKWQLKARREKRKFSLAQAALNQEKDVSDAELEAALDAEFVEWQNQLDALLAEQLDLLEQSANTSPLSPSETREIKKLHRILIKRLHPDIHPNLSEEGLRFFMLVQTAYENGDLDMLKSILAATEEFEKEPDVSTASEEDLEIEIAMTEAQLAVAREKLDDVKNSYPYTLSELLDNPLELSKRKKELEAEIARQKEVAKSYKEKIEKLLNEKKEK